MALSYTSVLIAFGLAFATVAGLFLSAPSIDSGLDRLKLLLNTLGLAIVVAGAVAGVVMLAWGLLARNEELIYFSLIPFAAAAATYGAITRRHMTWWGVFGFYDAGDRWRSFWDETRRLWGYGPSPRTRRAQRWSGAAGPAAGGGATPGTTRSFTFSLNLGGGAGNLLGPVARFAAQSLTNDRVSVFPTAVHFSVPAGLVDLASYRHELTVRRNDGGPLQLAVSASLGFLGLAVGPQGVDGSYPIVVSLLRDRLDIGTHSGAITIETGDPWHPRLIVPVTTTIG